MRSQRRETEMEGFNISRQKGKTREVITFALLTLVLLSTFDYYCLKSERGA
jgi:hypothetical protein